MPRIAKSPVIRLRKSTGFVLFGDLIQAVRVIASRLNIKLNIDGYSSLESSDGLTLFPGSEQLNYFDGQNPFSVIVGDDTLSVNANSRLFMGLAPSSEVAISGLSVPLPAADGTQVYLEVAFGTWPAVSSAEVKTGIMGAPVEFSGGVQTKARKLICVIGLSEDALVPIGYTTTHLRMHQFTDAAQVISYPVPS